MHEITRQDNGTITRGFLILYLEHTSIEIPKILTGSLTLIRLGFLRVVFSGGWERGGQFDPLFIFQEKLI